MMSPEHVQMGLEEMRQVHQVTERVDGNIRNLQDEMRRGFDRIDQKFDKVDVRFEKLEEKIDKVDVRERLTKVETQLDAAGWGVSKVAALVAAIIAALMGAFFKFVLGS